MNSFKPGDNIAMQQPFNATCGTIEAITTHADGTRWALCDNAYDTFGKCPGKVSIPLAHAKAWPYAPRVLSRTELVAL